MPARGLDRLCCTLTHAYTHVHTLQVKDGPNDEGEYFMRPGRLSDRLPIPYDNEQVRGGHRTQFSAKHRARCSPGQSRAGGSARTQGGDEAMREQQGTMELAGQDSKALCALVCWRDCRLRAMPTVAHTPRT